MTAPRVWTVVVVVFAVASIAWSAFKYRQHLQIEAARQAAPQALRDFTTDFPMVLFVRVEGDLLTFSWAEEVARDGERFIEQVEHQGRIREPGVARANQPALAYAELTPGQELRVDMEHDPVDPSRYVINAAYIVE